MWRWVTWLSPSLRDVTERKHLTNDLLWLGLMLGLGALWCLSTNLHAGGGLNALIVCLAAMSALCLGGGWALDRRAS
ncbi:MAG: hypothetical protein R3F62_09610 [Planctomycetota bacterium]